MDQLVSNLVSFVESFGATIGGYHFNTVYHNSPIISFKGYQVVQSHDKTTVLNLQILEEEQSMLKDPKESFYYFLHSNKFNQSFANVATISSVHFQRESFYKGYVYTLEIHIGDTDKFSNLLFNYKWNSYSNEFDSLLEEKLKD